MEQKLNYYNTVDGIRGAVKAVSSYFDTEYKAKISYADDGRLKIDLVLFEGLDSRDNPLFAQPVYTDIVDDDGEVFKNWLTVVKEEINDIDTTELKAGDRIKLWLD